MFQTTKVNVPRTKTQVQQFSKGDRVYSAVHQQEALVYEDTAEETVTIFLDKELINVPRKRLTLKMSAEKLYPVGYELDHLFTDFQTRKWQRDLARGSKKRIKNYPKKLKNDEKKRD